MKQRCRWKSTKKQITQIYLESNLFEYEYLYTFYNHNSSFVT